MKATSLFRAAAVVLLVFAVGHTVGFLAFRPPSSDALAVWEAMGRVHFAIGRSSFSYGGFYRGFGFFVTVYQVFAAMLAWRLGAMTRRGAADVAFIAWGLIALQIVSLVLALLYFSAGPAALSGIAALLLIAAITRRRDLTERG